MTDLAAVQMQHARTIVGVVQARALPIGAAVICLEVGIAESGLRVLANSGDPSSLALPNDGTGWDHDSSGIYQQRPGWGSIQCRMDPACSTGLFLDEMLRKDPDWASKPRWVVAQDVQVSAYDGTARDANNYTGEYGGNYHAQDATAAALAQQLWTPDQEDDEMGPFIIFGYKGAVWLTPISMAYKAPFKNMGAVTSWQQKAKSLGVKYVVDEAFDQSQAASIPPTGSIK